MLIDGFSHNSEDQEKCCPMHTGNNSEVQRVVTFKRSNSNQCKRQDGEVEKLSILLPPMWLFQGVLFPYALEDIPCGWAASCIVLWSCDHLRSIALCLLSPLPCPISPFTPSFCPEIASFYKVQIDVKRRDAKSKGGKERYKHLNAEFQRIARRDKKAFLSDQCKEIEENNRMGKTRDLFKKIRDTKGTFHAKMGSINDRNGMDLTEAYDIKKRWQEYIEELYKKRSSWPR